MKPPRICACNQIVPHGELCACQIKAKRARDARHDTTRPTAAGRGYDHKWRKARAEYLLNHSDCRMCANSATTIDHIIPHRGDRALFWNGNNWQPLCTPCHNSVKQRQERNQ